MARADIMRLITAQTAISLALLLSGCYSLPHKIVNDEPYTGGDTQLLRVAFGSCNLHKKTFHKPWTWKASQSYWKNIDNYFSAVSGSGYPDVWVWGGDIVYADTKRQKVLKDAYDAVKSGEYRVFEEKCRASGCQIVGVWDDHDFGGNDLVGDLKICGDTSAADKGCAPVKCLRSDKNPFRVLTISERKAELLRFLEEPTTSKVPRGEAVYTQHQYERNGVTIRLLVLDLRSGRQDPEQCPGNPRIMDDTQWSWLERHLEDETVDLHLIVSSTQVLRTDGKKESWGQYPGERDRLLSLIGRTRAQGVVLLTGDIHGAEISRYTPDPEARRYEFEFPLYEITASGLNRLRCRWLSVCGYDWRNEHRQGFVRETNFGEIEVSKSADGTLRLTATLRSTRTPDADVLLRKRIEFAPRRDRI